SGGGDGGQVRARALHPEDAHLAPDVVCRRLLRGRVPAPLIRECTIRAEQIRAVGKLLEHAEPRCGRIVPPVFGRRNAVEHRRGFAHELTSSGVPVETSAVKRSRAADHSEEWEGSYVAATNDERTTSRAWSSDPSSPSVIAWTSRLPIKVASSGPAITGIPVASAVHWQSRWFRAPPPTMS